MGAVDSAHWPKHVAILDTDGLVVSLFVAAGVVRMSKIQATFQGELQLAGWSETHNGGCKVTFWLPDAAELDAFRALTVRKGNTAGHRFMAALVEIGDDEQPVQHEPESEKSEDDYGQHYAALYKSGWFHNPKVVAALGVPTGLPPDERINTIKCFIYEYFDVDSLANIPPNSFIGYCIEAGIRATLPAAFGAA
jgi:hypothetical protein